MEEVVLKLGVPKDLSMELGMIRPESWQLLFSRFLKRELEEIKEIDLIVSKSKATQKQVNELADEVSLSIAKRLSGK